MAYQGPLEVPTELGLPHDSTESSSSPSEENDGDSATRWNEAIIDPGPETESEGPAKTDPEMGAEEAHKGLPRRPAKPTTKPSEYVYI